MAAKKKQPAAEVKSAEHNAKIQEQIEHEQFTSRDAVLDVAYTAAEACDACSYLREFVSSKELTRVFDEELTASQAFWLSEVINKAIDALYEAKEAMHDAVI